MALPKQVKVLDRLGKMSREWFAALQGADAVGSAPIVLSSPDASLPAARVLTAGTNVTLDTSTAGQIVVNAGGGGGSGGGNITPDTHPVIPSAWDDEFEYGTAIDTAGARRAGAQAWQTLNLGTSVLTVEDGCLWHALPADTAVTQSLRGVLIPISGSAWKVRCCQSFASMGGVTQAVHGIAAYDSVGGRFWLLGKTYNGGQKITVLRFPSATTTPTSAYAADLYAGTTRYRSALGAKMYFEIELSGGSLFGRLSDYGNNSSFASALVFNETLAAALNGATPTHIGLLGFCNNSSVNTASYDWFRRIS